MDTGSGSSMIGGGLGFGFGAGIAMGLGIGFSSGRGIPFLPGVDSNERGEGAMGGINGGKDGAIAGFQSIYSQIPSNTTHSLAWEKPT